MSEKNLETASKSTISNDIEDQILKLWHDPNWIGSFRGIKTFQLLLKTEKNIDISTKELTKILRNDSLYLMHLRPKVQIHRRHYYLNTIGELLQSDLGYMFSFNVYKYFLLVIDCYSLKIFVKALHNKTSASVLASFEDILKNFSSTTIYKIEVDQGTEFNLVSKYCKTHNIIFKYKYGQNKANFAEWGILMIKRRLYKILRSSLTQDWPSLIEQVANDHNNTPQKKLGFLKPSDINTPYDSAKVTKAKKLLNIPFRSLPLYKQQQLNQSLYKNNGKKLQIGDYVYVDFKQTLFGKSFDVQVYYYLFLLSLITSFLIFCFRTLLLAFYNPFHILKRKVIDGRKFPCFYVGDRIRESWLGFLYALTVLAFLACLLFET